MKHRIVFAAGPHTELAEVKDALAGLVPDWELVLAPSGLQALDHLTRQKCDALVADLQLSDLTGLQLANQVLRQWPHTHRVILADLGEIEPLVRCVGGVHQFLTRPCEAARLQVVLERAFALETWLPNQTVRKLLGSLPKLPSSAKAYHAVVDELRRDKPSLAQAAQLVAQDPAMSAKILQLANSAAYGPPLDEADPVRAVQDLGLGNTRRMLLLAHSYSAFKELDPAAFAVETLTDHARRTGDLARRIASLEGAGKDTIQQAATAGLLHDLGKVALAANLPEQFQRARALVTAQQLPAWEAEQAVFGATHGEVAGCLLGIWGLPMPVVEAVALHHHPARLLSDAFSPLTAVHIANALDAARSVEEARRLLDLNYLRELGVTDHLPAWWRCRDAALAASGLPA